METKPKGEGSGLRRSVEGGERGGVAKTLRRDPQLLQFGLVFCIVLTMLVVLWLRSSLNTRIDELEGQLSALPKQMEPVFKKHALAATKADFEALEMRIDKLERDLKTLRTDVIANWNAVQSALKDKP